MRLLTLLTAFALVQINWLSFSAAAMPGKGIQIVQATAGAFSESQLLAYVAAVLKIHEIDKDWQPRIDGAESSVEAAALIREATEKMIAEVEAQGLSLEEYNAITQAAEADDRLYDRIRALLAKRR